MAFGGILLLNIILMIVLGMAFIGIVCLIVSLIFLLIHLVGKTKGKSPKKRNVVIAAVCGIAGLVFLIIPILFFVIFYPNDKVEVQTPYGTEKVLERETNAFQYAVRRDELDEVKDMLKDKPELLWHICEGSQTALGAAVDARAVKVAEYLLEEYNIDIDVADSIYFDTTMTLACKELAANDPEENWAVLNLLMDYDANLNRDSGGITPIMYLLTYIVSDAVISEDELAILERFLAEGAYVTFENLQHEDALDIFEHEVSKQNFPEEQKEVTAMRELLNKYHEMQTTEEYNPESSGASCQELLNVLAEFEITDIPDERMKEIYDMWDEISESVPVNRDKMELLLAVAGAGIYDEETFAWRPTSNTVFCFDMEAYNTENMYQVLLTGLSSISRNQVEFTNIVQDDGKDYYDRKVSFTYHDKEYTFEPEFGGDWYDYSILNLVNQILEEEGNPMRYYHMIMEGQQVVVFFGNEEWVADFSARTGFILENEVK